MLAEGQQDGEIKLLSVDMAEGKIKVNNHGIIQIICLSQTPSLIIHIATMDEGKEASRKKLEAILAANAPILETASSVAADEKFSPVRTAMNSSISKNDFPRNSASIANASGSETSALKSDPWWVVGSKTVEEARTRSADDVARGKAEPQPLTPLTPPGTPAYLIGSDQLFFDHL